jgi:hypothetical protein
MGIFGIENYQFTSISIATNTSFVIEIGNYQDANQVFAQLLTTLPQNDSAVAAIGYTTRSAEEQRSAVALFAIDGIPALAANGFTDVVLAIFPSGDVIDQELEKFNQTGRIGAEMRRFIDVLDRPNFELLLAQARQYHITLHAGGVNYTDVDRTIFHPGYGIEHSPTQRLRDETARNSEVVIRALVAEGKRVAFFGPCLYVNPHPRSERAYYSFGRVLAHDFPNHFTAINIVIPEITVGQSYRKDLDLPLNFPWVQIIPQIGINLITCDRNSHLIVLPRH